ncbi:MAG: BMC domain-containing protein [Clostridia bacterium]|nr:BMC domain-containing protein [Clostridia bacterium]
MKALGMMEVYGFPTVVNCADIAAKAADVKVIAFDRNRPFGKFPVPLIMQLKIEGSVSAVRSAIEAATSYAKSVDKFIVSHIIANPGEGVEKMAYKLDINKDKFNKKLPKTMLGAKEPVIKNRGAIGLLEVEGLVASIVGLDSMLKAADIRLIHTEKRLGGRLVTMVVTGSVSSVNAAIEAGKTAVVDVGKVYGDITIPSPHDEVLKFFDI